MMSNLIRVFSFLLLRLLLNSSGVKPNLVLNDPAYMSQIL